MTISERDPLGRNPHQPGAKLDAGKIRAWLFVNDFSQALSRVAEVTTYGAEKYTPGGWVCVPDAEARYLDAAMRHLLKSATEEVDMETGLPHLAHAAWNLLAVQELRERG